VKTISKEEFLKVWLDVNLTADEVARTLRMSCKTVRAVANRFGYCRERSAYCDRRAAALRARLPSKKEFTEAWDDESLTRIDIAKRFNVSLSTLCSLAKRYDLPTQRDNYTKTGAPDPTPEEIAKRAAEVRAGWSEARARRKEHERHERMRGLTT